MPAFQLIKTFYIKSQKVVKGPTNKQIHTDLTLALNNINSSGHTNISIGS